MSKKAETENSLWPADLDDDAVSAYLKAHPDFLNQNPKLLDALNPPAVQSGKGIVDFQQALMQKLRGENQKARQNTRTLIETSQANLGNQGRVHSAVLLLLEGQNFDEFIQIITQDLAIVLDIDVVSLIVETDGQEDFPNLQGSGVQIVPLGTTDAFMGDQDAILRSHVEGEAALYGAGANRVFSDVVLRLEVGDYNPLGMLAFGSSDPEMFGPDQGTELIGFLGHVVERCMRIWLELPN